MIVRRPMPIGVGTAGQSERTFPFLMARGSVMWGKCLIACAALAALVAAGPVRAQTSDQQWDWCKGDNPDLSIGGCTAIIQSGQETTMNLAIAFYDRGNAYDDKG